MEIIQDIAPQVQPLPPTNIQFWWRSHILDFRTFRGLFCKICICPVVRSRKSKMGKLLTHEVMAQRNFKLGSVFFYFFFSLCYLFLFLANIFYECWCMVVLFICGCFKTKDFGYHHKIVFELWFWFQIHCIRTNLIVTIIYLWFLFLMQFIRTKQFSLSK